MIMNEKNVLTLQPADGLDCVVKEECYGRKYEKALGIAEKTA